MPAVIAATKIVLPREEGHRVVSALCPQAKHKQSKNDYYKEFLHFKLFFDNRIV
jgi:hypothetical protein